MRLLKQALEQASAETLQVSVSFAMNQNINLEKHEKKIMPT